MVIYYRLILCFIFSFIQANGSINLKALTQFEGLETVLYSPTTGYPYLKINYFESLTERKKVGFLKFGISFLKVKNLRMVLDLRQCDPHILVSKWTEFVQMKSIQYANMEPVRILIVDRGGQQTEIKANQGKFTVGEELRLWGDVSVTDESGLKKYPRLSLIIQENPDVLQIKKREGDVLELPFG